MLFENRSSLIARNRFRIKTTTHRFIWILLNILWFMTIILPPAFNKPDQMEAKMLVLNVIFVLEITKELIKLFRRVPAQQQNSFPKNYLPLPKMVSGMPI